MLLMIRLKRSEILVIDIVMMKMARFWIDEDESRVLDGLARRIRDHIGNDEIEVKIDACGVQAYEDGSVYLTDFVVENVDPDPTNEFAPTWDTLD